jgi:hypothetical protein
MLRRADAATVIGAALLAKAGGAGHRRIAEQLERPSSTLPAPAVAGQGRLLCHWSV